MAFNIETTLTNIRDFLEDHADIDHAVIGQLRSAPNFRLTGMVFMNTLDIAQVTLSSTIEVQTVTVRLIMNLLRYDPEEVELELAKVASEIIEDLLGDYDLGATIRNIDVAGQHSDGMGIAWGNSSEEGAVWRFVDINVPLIIDGSASLAA